jgi:hypothetical protein
MALATFGVLLAGLVGTGTGLTLALDVQGACYLTAATLALRLTGAPSEPGNPASRPPGPPSTPEQAAVDQRPDRAGSVAAEPAGR